MIVAITDPGGQYEYPSEVGYEIRQGSRGDYARAAEFINYSGAQLVSLQHERGIFGGDDGVYVLDLLAVLRVPTIATLHTVLQKPSKSQRLVVQRMAGHCAGLVVMSQVAADLLGSSYDVSPARVRVIPHGIPEMDDLPRPRCKARFGVAGGPMLLTFGLLGPSKGVEVVLRALPKLTAEFPDLRYFVVGATHPHIVRRHGEAYRTALEREAEELGVRGNVVFRDQFVTNEELYGYLRAADILVSPYHNEAQVMSGALSYAKGGRRRGRFDAVLARAGAARQWTWAAVPVRRQRGTGRDPPRAVVFADRARAHAFGRPRIHPAIRVAAHR